MLLVACVVPALFAAAHAVNVADAAHDEGTIRAVGLGWTGAWRAIDAALASALMWLPLGTRALRASLVGALLAGLAGAVLYRLIRDLLASCASAPRFGAVVACVATLTVTVGAPFQIEASAPGGSIAGALLALLPLAWLAARGRDGDAVEGDLQRRYARIPLAAFGVGAALAYEPVVGLAAAASCAAFLVATWLGARRDTKTTHPARIHLARLTRVGAAFVALGAVPFALALLRARASREVAMGVSLFASWIGERGASAPSKPLPFLLDEVGWLLAALALGGAVLGIVAARARALTAALVLLSGIGAGAIALGAPAGPTRFAAPVLVGIAALLALAGIGMQAAVRAVSAARVPFAKASAAMVVVLELTFPVHMADDSFARCLERARGAAETWNDVATGPLPVGAVVLVSQPAVMKRLLAARASGELRGDLAVVPTFDLAGTVAREELAREPKLASYWRDMALSSEPEEFSLSEIAASRPLVALFDAKWARPLARHLVPVGLFALFETEPRGLSDRKRALDAFVPRRDELARLIVTPPDPELIELTGELLRARVIALAASNDRDLIGRGVDDLRMFQPDDRVALSIGRRVASTKGPIEVRDLAR